jgi:hypothetical protein
MTAKMLTINVKNNSPNTQSFCFFQGQMPSQSNGVYSNSLLTQQLLPYASSGAILSFMMIPQTYAGVQQQSAPPQVGQPSGLLSAIQAIQVAAPGTVSKNTTTMTVSPSLGLSSPVANGTVQPGAFRIITPPYNTALQNYNAGCAVETLNGGVLLSSFITAQPNSNIDFQPSLVFYVATSNFVAGTVVDYTQLSSTGAMCDFTPGYAAYAVSYNADGTWTTQPYATAKRAHAEHGLELVEAAV